MKQYLYIVQSSLEKSKCKIGITNDLNRRLKEYNAITGTSAENTYSYLFTCEVSDMRKIEQDIKNHFIGFREQENREIYFYNPSLFDMYVDFISSHACFIARLDYKPPKDKKIVKPLTTRSMQDRGVTRKLLLDKAMRYPNDEFYTRYEDVEKEFAKYPLTIWKDKCVFCNCDDPVGQKRDHTDSSAFALYFLKHFHRLKLKKLICTHYSGGIDLFNTRATGYIFTKDGFKEIKNEPPNYTGSFEEKESVRILNEEADIVCTNPPFSKATEYWQLLIKSKKKFIIISNITNCVNTGFIPYFANKKAWAGYNRVDWYLNPKMQLVQAAGHFFTNITIKNRPTIKRLKFLPLNEIPDVFKKYDDSGTLLVNNSYIPIDYDKPFAVSARQILNGVLECGYKIVQLTQYVPYINEKKQFTRVLIQKIDAEA
ncbi:DNA methyltransferase [Helicobacter jaachi]|uniref:DNA methyltransferase n=1 Tax=Helicobacter jaachi TaxID=1677920 RepID=A0A4U8TBS6_9HELI|nr:adenine-specific methyltransferase EcoRI family protein [Helicobacter jaachi]TLD97243.1 DNA methyltransferase [Helicobacter jaachi]